jgi:PAS domain S-box-containing protein
LASLLRERNCEILETATDARQAAALCAAGPDLVFLDTALPDFDAASSALADCHKATIIYISSSQEAAPSPLFIKNPMQADELDAILRVALHTGALERAEASLQERLGTLLSILPEIAVRTDASGVVTGMNPTAELCSRMSVKKATGKAFADVFNLRDMKTRTLIASPSQIPPDAGQGTERFMVLDCGASQQIIVRAHNAVIRDLSGAPASYFLLLEDVTHSHNKNIERALLGAALDIIEEGVVITGPISEDVEPGIRSCNAAFEALSGWRLADIKGQPLNKLLPSPREEYWQAMRSSLLGVGKWSGEGSTVTSSGREIMCRWTASVLRDEDGKMTGCVFALQDRTHLHRLEESIRQSQKIEAVGRLASGIAHDFNNLLSVINSYCDLQILKLEEGSPAMKYAQQIRSAGRKGVDLVSQLMTFSRKDRPNPTSLDLSHVVEDVKGMLRRVIREDIEMDTTYGENIAPIKADQGQVEQILLNLCVNARDAMPNGGRLHIEVRNHVLDRSIIRSRETVRQGSYVMISVEDSGCGMDEETQKRIFDPFFTTKEIGKGTGLGLATVQSIVKQYGGYIFVRSRPGEGTRFDILFPSTETHNEQTAGTTAPASNAPTGCEKVFIVEDDETFLDCIGSLLRLHGYKVFTANDGGTALEMMEKLSFDIDMLVSDLVLPKLSGREVAARILDRNPKVKVVFMTGYDDQLDSFYSLPCESIVLEKPFPLNTLLVKIRDMLDGR